MSETWYEATSWGGGIHTAVVEKVSESTIWIRSPYDKKLHMKRIGDDWFRTWFEAKAELVKRAERRLEGARLQVEFAQKELDKVQALSRPQEESV